MYDFQPEEVIEYYKIINSKDYFGEYIDGIIEDIIERHMFPLNILPPKYKEGWLITIVDKVVSLVDLKKHCKQYQKSKKNKKF